MKSRIAGGRSPQLDIKDLRCFVAIVDAGSLTRGAALLNIVQPALSSRLRRIEEEIGVTLLVRSAQGVVPTEEGQIFYVAAKRILRDVGDVAEQVRDLGRHPSGHVSIGCTESTAAMLAVPLIEAILERYPKIKLSFVAGQSIDIYRRLMSGELDLAIISMNNNVPGLSGIALFAEELFLAVSAESDPLPDRQEVSTEELASMPIILPSAAVFSTQNLVTETLEVKGFELHVALRVDALEIITSLVRRGVGHTILGWSALYQHVERGELRLKNIVGGKLWRPYALCRPANRQANSAIEAVQGAISDTVKALIGSGRWRNARFIPPAG